MSYRRHYIRGPLIWARDGESENAAEHPAYLLLNNEEEDYDTIINDNDIVLVDIEWSATGSFAQIPKSRIHKGLATRRKCRASSSNEEVQEQPIKQEVKIKVEDSVYNYDTDEDGHAPSGDQKVTPSPVLSSSAAGVKMEDVYDYDTDDDSKLPPPPMKKRKSNSSATTGKQNKKKKKEGLAKKAETIEGEKFNVPKSIKQKEKPRDMIGSDISYLGEVICESGNWNDVKRSSFNSSEMVPLDFVQFNEERGRYEVEEGSNITEDDMIIQAMVMFALYRMEKGWGRGRSWKALSVWSGKPANDADIFPLENLWKEEIQQTIDNKQLGKNTLGHFDNFDNFPRFYGGSSTGRWSRRSSSYIGQVHIFAEQATVQIALHLHKHISREYALLASLIILYAFENDFDLMSAISFSLENSARKESKCFPKTALDDLCSNIRDNE